MNQDKFQPPTHLSARAQEIWSAIVPQNARTIGRLTLLQAALESLDLCDRASTELGAVTTLTMKTLASGNVRQHPAFKTLKEARQQFLAMWTALGLNHYGEDQVSFEYWLKQQEREP